MSVARSGMTENEQKQQLSIAYVHAVAARAGYACQVISVDNDSIDVQLAARGFVHEQAVLRSPKVEVQLKATSQPVLKESHLTFPLPVKNYNDLREPVLVPRILVVFLLPEDDALWLVQSEDAMITKHCASGWLCLVCQKPRTRRQSQFNCRATSNSQSQAFGR